MVRLLGAGLVAGALLWGCTAAPPASSPAPTPASQPVPQPEPASAAANWPHYRCDQGIEFTVRFSDDTAMLDSAARGNEVLLRDAGGVTPQQTVYSNPRLRAEFGLGTAGREAILRYLAPALVAHCVLD
jgi:hypothetical protein